MFDDATFQEEDETFLANLAEISVWRLKLSIELDGGRGISGSL